MAGEKCPDEKRPANGGQYITWRALAYFIPLAGVFLTLCVTILLFVRAADTHRLSSHDAQILVSRERILEVEGLARVNAAILKQITDDVKDVKVMQADTLRLVRGLSAPNRGTGTQ